MKNLLIFFIVGMLISSCTIEEIVVPEEQPYFTMEGKIDGNTVRFQAGINDIRNSSEEPSLFDSIFIDPVFLYNSTFSKEIPCTTIDCNESLSFFFYSAIEITNSNEALQVFPPQNVSTYNEFEPSLGNLYLLNQSSLDLDVFVGANSIEHPLMAGVPYLLEDLFFLESFYRFSRPDVYNINLITMPLCTSSSFFQFDKLINPITIKSIDDHTVEIAVNQQFIDVNSIRWSDEVSMVNRVIDLTNTSFISVDYIDTEGCIGFLEIEFLSMNIPNSFDDSISIELFSTPIDLMVDVLYVDAEGNHYESCECVNMLDFFIGSSKAYDEKFDGREVIEMDVLFSGELLDYATGDIINLEGFSGKIALSY